MDQSGRAADSGNSRIPLEPICDTDQKRTSASEMKCDINWKPVHGQQQEFDGWAEQFKTQVRYTRANVVTVTPAVANYGEMLLDSQTEL